MSVLVQSLERAPFMRLLRVKDKPANWCCSTFLGRSPTLHLQFKCSSVCFIFFQVLGLSCAAGRRIQTATLTWMWMEMTHSNTGNHSIVFERLLLRGKPEVQLPWVDNLCPALLEVTQPSPVTMLCELGGIPVTPSEILLLMQHYFRPG